MSSFSAKSSPIKLGGLQALRAVAVILVVYFHVSTAVYDYHGAATDTLLYGLHRIGPAGVDIFFVISGFIMAYTRRDNAAGMRDARVFITRRIERVIPLYWLWTAVVLMLDRWIHSQSPCIPRHQDNHCFAFAVAAGEHDRTLSACSVAGMDAIIRSLFLRVFCSGTDGPCAGSVHGRVFKFGIFGNFSGGKKYHA
jgi:hypothetical protein